MKTKSLAFLAFALFVTLFLNPATAFAQGTAFTYQGRLNSSGSPANGSYDLTFALFSVSSGAGQVGVTLTNTATPVSNGVFTVTLDFGANFPGANRWLEIAVRTNGGASFATLIPRQALTATPYAMTAGTATSLATPVGMTLIPAGAFTMGDTVDGDPYGYGTPTVTVSAFYVDVNLVSYSQWQSVYYWATNHGYNFVNPGSGKLANSPVQTVDWYNAVKWCNARSQQAGLTPVYYTDAGLTKVYTNGEVAITNVNWSANGYRLPTEAEWEKAARGGLSAQRFPWGKVITENLANYYGSAGSPSYDLGPNGYNSIGSVGGTSPPTSPVGSFAPNGYGLYDMSGNVAAWCWDWYAATPFAGGTDPRGPTSGSFRVIRGGYWDGTADLARCADRSTAYSPTAAYNDVGFRCVRAF
jgi:formylglycine-generating enzyme required for sulfatase activity